MTLIIPGGKVFCPLCDEPFSRRKTIYLNHIVEMYYCRKDKIFTFDFDPAFNKWRDTDKVVECPQCKSEMRWFSRLIDTFCKMQCPRCGLVVCKDSDVSVGKKGIEIEDFKENQEAEEVEIKVPIDKLNISAEKKAKLKKQVREGKKKC